MAEIEVPCIVWRKSKVSGASNCVEVAVAAGSVLIRDSADSEGVVLTLPPAAWSTFLARTREGLDLRVV